MSKFYEAAVDKAIRELVLGRVYGTKTDNATAKDREASNDRMGRMLSLMATRLGCEITVPEIMQFFEEVYDLDTHDVMDAMVYAQAVITEEPDDG